MIPVVSAEIEPAGRERDVHGDHRALDGARGARFLGALADLIEEPLALLV